MDKFPYKMYVLATTTLLCRWQVFLFRSLMRDERGAKAANEYRKNLLAHGIGAWNALKASPGDCLLQGFKPFLVVQDDRYVPSEEDVVEVLQQAEGQDLERFAIENSLTLRQRFSLPVP